MVLQIKNANKPGGEGSVGVFGAIQIIGRKSVSLKSIYAAMQQKCKSLIKKNSSEVFA